MNDYIKDVNSNSKRAWETSVISNSSFEVTINNINSDYSNVKIYSLSIPVKRTSPWSNNESSELQNIIDLYQRDDAGKQVVIALYGEPSTWDISNITDQNIKDEWKSLV